MYQEITYQEDGPIGTITLNRPQDGNMFTLTMCHEIRDCINEIRRETRTRVIVLTGAGDRFFCLGGRKEGMEDTQLYAGVLPTLEMYESIDRLQKPVIASVNGMAVGGGNVLQMVCDVTIAADTPKIAPQQALDWGLINRIVPAADLQAETRKWALEIADRGAFALASVKAAFNARHGGVSGLSRMAHDLLLRGYLETEEHDELAKSFAERRKPDSSKFGH